MNNLSKNISTIILSYNSEETIKSTVESALEISNDVHVVDSYSDDETLAILAEMMRDEYDWDVISRQMVDVYRGMI